MDARTRGMKCGFCEKITKYKCMHCQLPACNRCTMFEEDEGATGWKAGESVGYCNDCQLTYSPTTVNSDVFESLDEERERLTPSPLPETNSSVFLFFLFVRKTLSNHSNQPKKCTMNEQIIN